MFFHIFKLNFQTFILLIFAVALIFYSLASIKLNLIVLCSISKTSPSFATPQTRDQSLEEGIKQFWIRKASFLYLHFYFSQLQTNTEHAFCTKKDLLLFWILLLFAFFDLIYLKILLVDFLQNLLMALSQVINLNLVSVIGYWNSCYKVWRMICSLSLCRIREALHQKRILWIYLALRRFLS